MKFKWTSSNLFLIKFLGSLLIIGIIVGAFLYFKESAAVKSGVASELASLSEILTKTKQNNFIYHLVLLSVLTILSLIVVGMPIILFYLFYEGVSFGFLLASLFNYKKIEGLFFGLIFGVINKLYIYLALIYLLIVSSRYGKKIIISLKNRDNHLYEHIANHLIRLICVFIIVLLIDIFIYFLGNKILGYFLFLL